MTEITKCPGKRFFGRDLQKCADRRRCWRFLAPSSEWQSWGHFWRPDAIRMGMDCYLAPPGVRNENGLNGR